MEKLRITLSATEADHLIRLLGNHVAGDGMEQLYNRLCLARGASPTNCGPEFPVVKNALSGKPVIRIDSDA